MLTSPAGEFGDFRVGKARFKSGDDNNGFATSLRFFPPKNDATVANRKGRSRLLGGGLRQASDFQGSERRLDRRLGGGDRDARLHGVIVFDESRDPARTKIDVSARE